MTLAVQIGLGFAALATGGAAWLFGEWALQPAETRPARILGVAACVACAWGCIAAAIAIAHLAGPLPFPS